MPCASGVSASICKTVKQTLKQVQGDGIYEVCGLGHAEIVSASDKGQAMFP